jgi:hypothetical protein
VDRLASDLGNPQRHLRRLLEQSVLPFEGKPTMLDRLAWWVEDPESWLLLWAHLNEIAEQNGEGAMAAVRCLRLGERWASAPRAIQAYLGAEDLASKGNGASYRYDAYSRLLLWIQLLSRMEGCLGPVLLIDEAENLYTGGSNRAERKTALRTLAFYCSGWLPEACVIMAITPESLKYIREEAGELLGEVSQQKTVLLWEDVEMFHRRLLRSHVIDVPKLQIPQQIELMRKIRDVHGSVRGEVEDQRWEVFLRDMVLEPLSPRQLVRATFERLEMAWWASRMH